MKVTGANIIANVGTTLSARLRLRSIDITPKPELHRIEPLRNFRTRTGTDVAKTNIYEVNVSAEITRATLDTLMRLVCPTLQSNVYVPSDSSTISQTIGYEIQTENGTYRIPNGYLSSLKLVFDTRNIPTVSIVSVHSGSFTSTSFTSLTIDNFLPLSNMQLRLQPDGQSLVAISSPEMNITIDFGLEYELGVDNTMRAYSAGLLISGNFVTYMFGAYDTTLVSCFNNNTNVLLEMISSTVSPIQKITLPRAKITSLDEYSDLKTIEAWFENSYVNGKYVIQYANA